MPLLGGLFSRKNKSSSSHTPSSTDDAASPTLSYVAPDKSLPSSPNGKSQNHASHSVYPSNGPPAASSSRLRLPFARKKSTPPKPDSASTVSVNTSASHYNAAPSSNGHYGSVPRTSQLDDDIDHRRLRPPPSKSAIFAAYGDPDNRALSTHSLPAPSPPLASHLSPLHTTLTTEPAHTTPNHQHHLKRPFFPWSKSTPSSPDLPPKPQPSVPSPNAADDDPFAAEPMRSSFNLKSFRHVNTPPPPLPSPSNNNSSNSNDHVSNNNSALSLSLNAPLPPRPRGASINSESSHQQRISVAAFREAQARRSLTGSPVPSFRAPSPSPHTPPISASSTRPQIPNRRSTALTFNSESEETDSEEEEEDESEEEEEEEETVRGRNGLHRQPHAATSPTTTARARTGKARAQSELGHGTAPATSPITIPLTSSRAPRSHLGHGGFGASYTQPLRSDDDEDKRSRLNMPRSQSSLSNYGTRQRASASTSAVVPSAAAKRASVVANANAAIEAGDSVAAANYKRASRHVRETSTYSNPGAPASTFTPKPMTVADTDSEDSDDDAPLATLLPPRRPGSAMSAYSNNNSRTNLSIGAGRSNSNLPGSVNGSNPHLPQPQAPASRSNSNLPFPGQLKPLIDINELIAGPKKPSLPSTRRQSQDGFTGAGTLLGGVISDSPASSPVATRPSPFAAPNATAGILTSTSPPGTSKFISPPASPAKELKAFEFVENERKSGAASSADSSSNGNQKRDVIAERLNRALKMSAGGGGGGGGNSNSGASVSGDSTVSITPSIPPVPSPPESRGRATTVSPNPTGRTGTQTQSRSSSPAGKLPQTSNVRPNSHRATTLSPDSIGRSGMQMQSRSPSPVGKLPQTPDVRPNTHKQVSSDFASSTVKQEPATPPDAELASFLGDTIQLISWNGSEDEDTDDYTDAETGSDDDEYNNNAADDKTVKLKEESIFLPPIPIKERSPPPAFSVTSRPQHPRNSTGGNLSISSTATFTPITAARQRSSTLISSPTSSAPFSSTSSTFESATSSATMKAASGGSSSTSNQNTRNGGRQRSSTMVTAMPVPSASKPQQYLLPNKPFAAPAPRRESPASSTGDSSSSRAPLTPKDGSEIGLKSSGKDVERERGGVNELGRSGKHAKRKSVNFNDEPRASSVVKGKNRENDRDEISGEERRRERRRGEARAAIELGNVINGPGPIVDDDDEDMPINHALNARMSAINPMMGMGMGMQMQPGFMNPNMNMWQQQQPNINPQMLSPAQFMVPPPNSADPAFLVAHQQAMMFAKQAYQIAVAQQAMAAAGDEWERGSTYGGGGGSVYGGGSGGSVMGMNMNSPYGMMGMPGMMPGWGTGSVYNPSPARSMYGGTATRGGFGGMSSSRSEYGGGGGGGNWSSSRTSYGDFAGSSSRNSRGGKGGGLSPPSQVRDSGYFPPMPPVPKEKERTTPRPRTTSQPANPRGTPGQRRMPPPSSWKEWQQQTGGDDENP